MMRPRRLGAGGRTRGEVRAALWTEAMLERLLRIDRQRVGSLSADRRLAARRALGAAFPDLDAARRALGALAALNPRPRQARKRWTTSEDSYLLAHYASTRTAEIAQSLGRTPACVYRRAAILGLGKSEEFFLSAAFGRLRPGDRRGESGRFCPGLTPWNKGLRGVTIGGVETRFKRGERNGKAAQLWMPIGSERVATGYLLVKVDDVPNVPYTRNWRLKHHLVWEAAGRTIPPGHVLVFRDGDRMNCSLENLELITRAEIAARNHHSHLPAELVELIFLTGWVKRRLRERTRIQEENHDGR